MAAGHFIGIDAPKGVHCRGTRPLRCVIGTLAPHKRVVLRATVRTPLTGRVINRVSVHTSTRETRLSDNAARAVLRVHTVSPIACVAVRVRCYRSRFGAGAGGSYWQEPTRARLGRRPVITQRRSSSWTTLPVSQWELVPRRRRAGQVAVDLDLASGGRDEFRRSVFWPLAHLRLGLGAGVSRAVTT